MLSTRLWSQLIVLLFFGSIFGLLDANAELRPAKIFSDNMVLQQGVFLPVWGMAEANTQITVQFAGQKEVVQSDEHGKWRLNLPPLKVNDEPQVFKVYSEKQTFSFKNVVVGEVWFSGGQSNMGYNAGSMAGRLELGKSVVSTENYTNVCIIN